MATVGTPLLERTIFAMEGMKTARSQQCVMARVAAYLREFGFSSFGLTRRTRVVGSEPDVLLDGWPEGWTEHYREARLYRHDPMAKHAITATDVFAWDEIPQPLFEDPKAAAVPNEAAELGLREGFCVPMPTALGVGEMWMGGPRIEKLPGLRQAVRLLGYQVAQAVENLPATPPRHPPLTVRERDVLAWVAAGKTARDIGAILSISDHTVGEHLKNIRRKLGTSNNAHSTVRALQLGLLRL